MMQPKQSGQVKAMEHRKNYGGNWDVEVYKAPMARPGYCLFSVFCSWCASYKLREQQLRGDWSRYLCCNGHLPCSGKFQEQKCPKFCMVVETCLCFAQSVASTRFSIQDELRVKNTKCDNALIGVMIALQYLACLCQIAACLTGNRELQELANYIDCLAQLVFCSVCACMQTQHKVQLDARDAVGMSTMAPQVQNIPQGGGGPAALPYEGPQGTKQGYPQQGGYPPQGGGYPPQGYPPQQGGGYPPQQGGGYPPQGYPGNSGPPAGQQMYRY